MPPITCHILDTTTGKPATEVPIAIFSLSLSVPQNNSITQEFIAELPTKLTPFAVAHTNNDGRISNWKSNPDTDLISLGFVDDNWETLKPGIYMIRFYTNEYFTKNSHLTFYPFIDIQFIVDNPPDNHYHIPLLLANHGYSTYRGS